MKRRQDRLCRAAARRARRAQVIDATGKAVSPGFINMLSWAIESLIQDGRGISDTQGVTLEVIGEGESMGPWNAEMKRLDGQAAGRHQISDPAGPRSANISNICEQAGISPNVASFVGATTVRDP